MLSSSDPDYCVSVSEPASSDTEKKPWALLVMAVPCCDNLPLGTVTRTNLPLGKWAGNVQVQVVVVPDVVDFADARVFSPRQ